MLGATAVAQRLRLMAVIVANALRRGRLYVARSLPRWRMLGGSTPSQLLIAPQDIRTSDPTIADDVYGGHFAFAGRIVATQGQSPFRVTPPSLGWSYGLMGFGWLRHLRAADTALARANARALVDDWITYCSDERGPAWHASVVARRLMSWLSQSPLILEGADWDFYRRFMRSIGRQATYLECLLRHGLEGEERLSAAIALASAGLCADGLARLQRRSTRYLRVELRRQILPDGGHVSRNPRVLVDILLDLLPLRQAYVARGSQAPAELLNAIDRMMPMLRLFRHADGELALFNGMGVTAPDALATLLAYDEAPAAAMHNAPYSGYQRLEAGDAVAIMDVGQVPPREFSAEAHAGCLSFEFSASAQRIIVNCGAPPPTSRSELRDAARATAAHSTLVVEETSSCRFATQRLRLLTGTPILSGPQHVACDRSEDESEIIVRASHDGYAWLFGIVHERRLRLAADGNRLTGEDVLHPPTGHGASLAAAYALRFHLHPAVRPQALGEGQAVALTLPGGAVWLFEASGPPVAIDDSAFFAAPDGTRRTHQLVIRANMETTARVSWAITRQAGLARQQV